MARKLPPPLNLATVPKDYLHNFFERLKVKELKGRIYLQSCILFSEMGKHELALKHARQASRLYYNLLWDHLVLYYLLLIQQSNESRDRERASFILTADRRQKKAERSRLLPPVREGEGPLLQLITILEHFIGLDCRQDLLNPAKEQLVYRLSHQLSYLNLDRPALDLEPFLANLNESHWLLKKKILSQIQLDYIPEAEFEFGEPVARELRLFETFDCLAISFYCVSTEIRFTEKAENRRGGQLLESEQWLGRSLEVAYLFLPHDAPILTQIHSVYLKFHGIGK